MGWFDWLRGKSGNGASGSSAPYRDTREGNAHWAQGDLGECINDNFPQWVLTGADGPLPVKGEVYRVVGVCDGINHCNVEGYWLYLSGCCRNIAFNAKFFRKIVQQKDEATDGNQVPDWMENLRKRVDA